MTSEPVQDSPPYVLERWWHRLFQVISWLAVLFVIGAFAVVSFDSARYIDCVYSFQEEYHRRNPIEDVEVIIRDIFGRKEEPAPPPPPPPDNLGIVDDVPQFCGGRDSARVFIEKYVARNRDEARLGKGKALVEKARQEGYSYLELAKFLLEKDRIDYKLLTRYRTEKLVFGLAIALLAGAATFGVMLLIHKYFPVNFVRRLIRSLVTTLKNDRQVVFALSAFVLIFGFGALLIFLFRYDVRTPDSSGQIVIRIDRLTGTIERCVINRGCQKFYLP